MQTILLYLAALGAGISVAVQQVLNGNLRISLQSPAWAGFVNNLGGLLTMVKTRSVCAEIMLEQKSAMRAASTSTSR